jgi:hypothetical protein
MRTRIQGLSQESEKVLLVEGVYRARVVGCRPAGHSAEPCRAVTFRILDPAPYAGHYVRTRLYCHDRTLWKLRWFLSDFDYDPELLAADILDDRHVVGLEGIIRLAYWGTYGRFRLDVEGFSRADRWPEISHGSTHPPPAVVQQHAEA